MVVVVDGVDDGFKPGGEAVGGSPRRSKAFEANQVSTEPLYQVEHSTEPSPRTDRGRVEGEKSGKEAKHPRRNGVVSSTQLAQDGPTPPRLWPDVEGVDV